MVSKKCFLLDRSRKDVLPKISFVLHTKLISTNKEDTKYKTYKSQKNFLLKEVPVRIESTLNVFL